jgi:hypothetical protein
MTTVNLDRSSDKNQFNDGGLPCLISARVRLSAEQRSLIKNAYFELKNSFQPEEPPRIGGSGVRTTTAQSVDHLIGLNHVLVSDILSSRDTIALPLILKLQKILKVNIITKEELLQHCQHYADYVYEQADL